MQVLMLDATTSFAPASGCAVLEHNCPYGVDFLENAFDLTGKPIKFRNRTVVEVPRVRHMMFRDNQRITLDDGTNARNPLERVRLQQHSIMDSAFTTWCLNNLTKSTVVVTHCYPLTFEQNLWTLLTV